MRIIETIGKRRIRNILVMLAAVFLLTAMLPARLPAQVLRGKVYTLGEEGDTVAVYMARLQWLNTTTGAMTEKDGSYRLPFASTDTLVVSYSFYKPDTLVISRDEVRTLPWALITFTTEVGIHYELIMAGATMVVLPMLLLFLFARKQIVRGVARGGIKG